MKRKLNRISISGQVLMILFIVFASDAFRAQIYTDPTRSVEERVNDLLSRMNIDEKAGQMAQVERIMLKTNQDVKNYFLGSVTNGGDTAPTDNTPSGWADMIDAFQTQALQTRLKIPILYGMDAVHGHNNLKDAVLFPHNIGLGCTGDSLLVFRAAQITAREVMGSGADWSFAPCVAVARNERWGRTYESLSEDPALAARLGAAIIKGFQGDSVSPLSILATAKHFLGDGGTTDGIDQGNTQVDEAALRRLFLPPYREAIKAGVEVIMASFSSWNGQKVHGSRYLLTTLLKEELNFNGFIISDWNAVDQLPGDYYQKVEAAVNAGIDMFMLPYNYKEFIPAVKDLVAQGRIPMSRIDDAVRRILRVKFRLGVFEHPYSDRTLAGEIGGIQHREVAREVVRKSLVLLKKRDNILPLRKKGQIIHVSGRSADNMGYQCGGWSVSWQGASGNITAGTTILQAIKNTVITSQVIYSADGTGASGSSIAVAVIGETPYAEGNGDRKDLSLSDEDIAVVRNLKASNVPVVVVLISGRPMILTPILHYADAIIAAWLPGTEGQGAADILFGNYQPSGKLSHTWPKSMAQIPINTGDASYDPLWPFGYGIVSLNNSPAMSAPILLSSALSADGLKVEAAFNKRMRDPKSDLSNFTVKLSTGEIIPCSNAALKYKDSSTIVLTLNTPAHKGELLTLSYKEGNLRAVDGGKLASFSSQEIYNILNERSYAFTVPGRVEAEFFNDMSGVVSEACSDTGLGENLGWINDNDWMEYLINVPYAGTYNASFRFSSANSGGSVKLATKDSASYIVNLPVTGSWQKWQTKAESLELKSGMQSIRLTALKGGFNLNWLEFDFLSSSKSDPVKPLRYALYQNHPNPFNPSTVISFQIPENGNVELKLYDLLGREIMTISNGFMHAGTHNINFNASGLPSGVYFYKISAGGFSETKKMLLLK